jgi:hypothetical protein
MKFKIILFLIIFGGFLVRFYNFSNRFTYGPEQARSLYVSAKYVSDKPSLLGQEYFRVNSYGHKIFSGALFNYSLVPLLVISDYHPELITAFFALLNIFTGVVLFILVDKIFRDKLLAVFSLIFFLFNDVMIYHSLFIWNYNFLPLVGILTAYLLYEYFKKTSLKTLFLLGVINGIGFSLQVLYLPIIVICFLAAVLKNRQKLASVLIFTSGVILGNLPMFVFDLRHNFYQIKTLLRYLLDTINGGSDAGYSYYYLLPLWPIAILLFSKFVQLIWTKSKIAGAVVTCVYLIMSLLSNNVDFVRPTGMEKGLTYRDVEHTAKIISEDVSGEFNVVSLIDFDKRGYILRYLIRYIYGKTMKRDEEYPTSDVVYALSEKSYDFNTSDVWEIKSVCPCATLSLGSVGEGYSVTKLVRI